MIEKEENVKILESTSVNEIVVVNEATLSKDNPQVKESIPVDEIKQEKEYRNDSKTIRNDVRKKLFGLNLLSSAGLLTATGLVIATSTGLINYSMSSSFKEFYYEDGKVCYQVEFDNLDIKNKNTLSLRINEEKNELIEYKLIYDYDTFIIDKNITNIRKTVDFSEIPLLVDEQNTISSYLNSLGKDEAISYTYSASENDISYYQDVVLMDKGKKGTITGYFTVNMDRIKEELSVDGEYMHYYATLFGSTGLLDRNFDRYAIKVTSLISKFNTISGECNCVSRKADGTYHVLLDFNDDYGYFDFKEIYMKDINGNESEKITEMFSWHSEIRIPVLNLSGSSEIHLTYIDTSTNQKVELIFIDGSKDILVRYDDGNEEIFESFENEFDIKV